MKRERGKVFKLLEHLAVFFLFGLIFYVQVNSLGHNRMVSSTNHTFFPGQA